MSSDAVRLPVRPQRCPDESFTSWVQRTAFSNGLRASDLFPARPNTNDKSGLPPRHFKPQNLVHLAQALDVDETDIEQDMKRHGVHATTPICPQCLAEQPHFRQSWLSPHTLRCVKHGVHLLSRCSFCDNTIPVYMPFKHRMHPALMLARFLNCRKCGHLLSSCHAEPDLKPRVHWQVYDLLNGFQLEPPFSSLTIALVGRVWPVRVLFVLYHQVVCPYTFHGKDRLSALWEGHPDHPQENPLGEYSTRRRKSIERIALLGWFLEGWPWRVHRFLRHVAYSTHPVEFGEHDWVSEVLKTFTLGHDPIQKFHLGYIQETLDRDRTIGHEDFLDHNERVVVQPAFQRLRTSLRVWSLEELPVVNVEECACARRWKEVESLPASRDKNEETA